MKKSELIKTTARICGLTESQARDVIRTLTNVITEELRTGEDVMIDGFGKFYVTDYPGREVVTPTGQTVTIDNCRSPRFKASGKLRTLCK